jgi:hypothetical protein
MLVSNSGWRPAMKILFGPTATVLALALGACGSGGNLRPVGEYNAPSPPAVRHPAYSPYAAYADEQGNWRPKIFDREGSMVRPQEPATENDRARYEDAPWAIHSTKALASAPRGTF